MEYTGACLFKKIQIFIFWDLFLEMKSLKFCAPSLPHRDELIWIVSIPECARLIMFFLRAYQIYPNLWRMILQWFTTKHNVLGSLVHRWGGSSMLSSYADHWVGADSWMLSLPGCNFGECEGRWPRLTSIDTWKIWMMPACLQQKIECWKDMTRTMSKKHARRISQVWLFFWPFLTIFLWSEFLWLLDNGDCYWSCLSASDCPAQLVDARAALARTGLQTITSFGIRALFCNALWWGMKDI